MLDADRFREMTFELTGTKNVKLATQEEQRLVYTLTLIGSLTVRDKAVPIETSATVTVLPFTFQTIMRYPGDLLKVECAFDLKLEQLGLSKPGRAWAERIADPLHFVVCIYANSVSPEKSLDPAFPQEEMNSYLRFISLARDLDQPVEAYALAHQFKKKYWTDAKALDRLTDAIIDEDGIQLRDLSLALTLARRATELTDLKDASMLARLARVHHLRGENDLAHSWQKKAVEVAGELPPARLKPMTDTLELYKKLSEQIE
jgi:hypothetical protein